MNKLLPCLSMLLLLSSRALAQPCTPLGDEISYGTNDTWIGYVYHNTDFTSYAGFVTEGSAGNPAFDQSYGGDDVNYATNGCDVHTSTFSVRYKLRKTFAAGGYQFTVGADDGFRLSLDGGNTWIINRWVDQGYYIESASAWLDGTYDVVLEFYENQGQNRLSFTYEPACLGSEDQSVYGTNDVWRGYVYDGTNFGIYKGLVTEGSPGNISFDESFGGSHVLYNTSSCAVNTETFSVRYRLRKTFPDGNYVFTVGADDGFRLSLDGGNTWVINRWGDQSYTTETYSANLTGQYDLVLEYYENGGDNRISLAVQSNVILDIDLLAFTAKPAGQDILLSWETSLNSDPHDFIVERSADGRNFEAVQSVAATDGILFTGKMKYSFTDKNVSGQKTWYRLRMRDSQYKTTLSTILLVNREIHTDQEWELYPTVVENGIVFLRGNKTAENVQWHLYSTNGQLQQSGELGRSQPGQVFALRLNEGKLRSGIYLLQLMINGTASSTHRVVIR